MRSPSSLLHALRVPASEPQADRGALLAGLTFVELAPRWSGFEVVGWLNEHLIAPGRMLRPTALHEGSLTASLDGGSDDELIAVVDAARTRVVATLQAFIRATPDDRFLKAAIFADRVQRRRLEKRSVWVARPNESDPLGDVVLSLFAVDVLMHRGFHETKLCVCEVCGRVSFEPAAGTRTGCPDHRPRSETNSGFVASQSQAKLTLKE